MPASDCQRDGGTEDRLNSLDFEFKGRMIMEKWPIGVFASVDAGLGVHWDVIRKLQVPTIQLHAPQPESRNPATADKLRIQLEEMGVRLTAIFGGFDDESYADIPTVEQTVGLVPEATRASRLAEMKEIADFAALMQCDVVALHLGFVPHQTDDPRMPGIVAVTQELCDHCAANSQKLNLETGQESAEGLVAFVDLVQRDNLFVNFDPANMILYGTGEPIPTLRKIGSLVRSVHCKDATWSDQPGKTWGAEVPLGEGDVDIRQYLQTLDEIGYTGPLTIEREIPQEPERQFAEIGAAVQLLRDLKSELAG